MTQIVNMHQAKTSLSRLIERALAGEEIVIARNGEPLVKLVPVAKERKRRVPGRGKGKIWISPDFEFTDKEITELFEGCCEAPPRHECLLVVAARITPDTRPSERAAQRP
jgi:prevent-host-death family protein